MAGAEPPQDRVEVLLDLRHAALVLGVQPI
jgi:hypothetical protein